MKNTGVKTIILCVVAVLAVAGVLVFLPTIFRPPVDVPMKNVHMKSLDGSINSLSMSQGVAYNDSMYILIKDKLELYHDEEFVNNRALDERTSMFVERYGPIFMKYCREKFDLYTWNVSDHLYMESRIEDMKGLKYYSKSGSPLSSSLSSELYYVSSVIDDYRKACSMLGNTSFTSVYDANERIDEARYYMRKEPICNCGNLVSSLESFIEAIGRSHYNMVWAKIINELANFRYMTHSEYLECRNEVLEEISAYRGNCHNYGLSEDTVERLSSEAADIESEAMEHFAPKKKIDVYTNGQWGSMSSPDYRYDAYRSESNHLRAGYNAEMRFSFTGYENFTFYIRSNGESSYDYLIVGLNERPTTERYYSTTKDLANSGTSLSSYRTVTFNNLSKYDTYTVYVIYAKDGSYDRGDDRGYVLIPKQPSYEY